MKKAITDRVPSKKSILKQKGSVKLQSEYYPLMKIAMAIVFIIIIISAGAIIYGLTNFYGLDISGQITAAATGVENLTPSTP